MQQDTTSNVDDEEDKTPVEQLTTSTKMSIDDEDSGTRTPLNQIANPDLMRTGPVIKGGKKKTRKKRKKKTRKKRKKKRKTLKIKRKDLKTKP